MAHSGWIICGCTLLGGVGYAFDQYCYEGQVTDSFQKYPIAQFGSGLDEVYMDHSGWIIYGSALLGGAGSNTLYTLLAYSSL